MYNWSTDEDYLKQFPEDYEKWRLLQLINYGLDGEKLDLTLLKKYWYEIRDKIIGEEKIEYIERFILCFNNFKKIKKEDLLLYAVTRLHSIVSEIKIQSFIDFYEVMRYNKKLTLITILKGLKKEYGYTLDPLFLTESFMKIKKIQVYDYYDNKEDMITYFLDLARSQKSKIIK